MMWIFSRGRALVACIGLLLGTGAMAQVQQDPARALHERIVFASGEHLKLASRYYAQALRTSDPESRQYIGTALEEAQLALRIYPDNAGAYGLLGLIYMGLKENDQAENAFRRAINLTPDEPELNNNYGLFLCETGKSRQSLEHFVKAVRNPLYETPEIAYTNAGRCALRGGDDAQAERYLEQAMLRAQDGAPLAKIQMAKMYFRRGQYEKSRAYLNDVIKRLDVATPEALLLGIRLERRLGNQIDEKSYEQRLRNRYPNSQEYQDFLNGKLEN